MDTALTRRQLMAVTAAGGAYVLLGCGGDDESSTTGAATRERASCVLTPEQTEGPYYIENNLIRSDITDGRDGLPLDLGLTVQDASSCDPIEKATVEIWHCDAEGRYSGVNGVGGNFLRGGRRTDANGLARFKTIYPGWYQGRTTHIHVKVHVGGDEVHTGQLYFDDETTAAVNRRAPYATHGDPEVTNAEDPIYAQGGDQTLVALKRTRSGYAGRIALGVRRSAS
jgi:protocatechuate 3,4-dioxygenase beta subunit